MKMLLTVVRDSMLSEVEALARENGISAYPIINDVKGMGLTGRVDGALLKPDINSIIFSALPSDHADRAVSAFTALHTAQGQPIPLKVFTLPCEKHV